MRQSQTKTSLLWHRNQLVRTLRDLQAGKKISHLAKGEKEILVANITQRIAALNVRINEPSEIEVDGELPSQGRQ